MTVVTQEVTTNDQVPLPNFTRVQKLKSAEHRRALPILRFTRLRCAVAPYKRGYFRKRLVGWVRCSHVDYTAEGCASV